METTTAPQIDPWRLEILVVREGARSSGERSAISRDLERGLLLRTGPRCYVERVGFESLSPEQQHLVRMRALEAASPQPLLFSHWSAAVLLGLPVLRTRLRTVHVTIPPGADLHRRGVTAHRSNAPESDVVLVQGPRRTTIWRTAVDVAGSAAFEEGVMAADRALLLGALRGDLEAAVDAAGERRAAGRIRRVVAFADPGGESAAESRFRASVMRAGFAPPELQHRVPLGREADAWLDGWFRRGDVGVEVDGEQKYLDPRMAPQGAGRAVVREKRREDAVRLHVRALIRPGWVQSGSPALLRSMLAQVGLHPERPHARLEDYIARSRDALPRVAPPRPPEVDAPSLAERGAPSSQGLRVRPAE